MEENLDHAGGMGEGPRVHYKARKLMTELTDT